MEHSFNSKYNALESDKTILLRTIEGKDEQELNYIINEGKWTIAHILYHIVKGEQHTLISLLNAIKPDVVLAKVTISAMIKSFLLNSALKTNFKFNAPPIALKMPASVKVDELIKKWDEIRKDLYKVCLNMPKEKYNCGVYKHPFIGMINLSQTLKFLLFHQRHHLKQIKELKKSLN